MMYNKKLLISIGAAIAASRLAKAVAGIDVLGSVGLTRRRGHLLENLALVGVGLLAGGAAAMLFAPTTGREARQRVGEEATRLTRVAKDAIRDHKDDAVRAISEATSNGSMSSQHS